MYACIVKGKTDTIWGQGTPRHKLETAIQDYVNQLHIQPESVCHIVKVHKRLVDKTKIPLQSIPVGDTGDSELIDYPCGSHVTILKDVVIHQDIKPCIKPTRVCLTDEEVEQRKYYRPFDYFTTWKELGVDKL